VRVVATEGAGIGAALTAALAASRAPLVAIMEADDRCAPDRLSRLAAALVAHPEWDGAVSRAALLGRRTDGMRRYLAWQNRLVAPDELARERFVEIPALLQTGLYRRALVERAGGFSEPERWPLDIGFWMRAFAVGARVGRVPRVLYRWRQHPAQDTRVSDRHRLESLARCKAHYFVRGPARERAIELVSVGETLARFRELLRDEGALEVRAHEWKPGRGPAPARPAGAVRLFAFGMASVRERIRAAIDGWDDRLDWFAA